MKYIKLFEYFSNLQYYDFDRNLIILLEKQKAHVETIQISSGKITYLKIFINDGWEGFFYFYQKNKSGITRFREENTEKMGTLISSQKSQNSIILEIKFDNEQNSQKLNIKIDESVPSCTIPESKYIPLKKNQESVKIIQKALSEVEGGKYKNILGNFGPNKDGIDGHYGCSTLKAVAQFQKDNNIRPAIGIFGPITSDVLSACLKRHIPYYGQKLRPASEPIALMPTKGAELIEKPV
jgi:hypothetical protein